MMTASLWQYILLFYTATLLQSEHVSSHNCIFDDVGQPVVAGTSVNYAPTGRRERSADRDDYRPIRITPFSVDGHLPTNQTIIDRVEFVVAKAITFISQLLAVYPVEGPLRFSRSTEACARERVDGDTVKCVVRSPVYNGEECLDGYKIPDEHLDGLYIWPDKASSPTVEYCDGPGLPDSDMVMYVKAEHTPACDKGEVLAYSAHCRVDQFNRPIAGVINFCPKYLKDSLYKEEEFIVVAIHEMFHVLGFSESLFNKFQDCSVNADGLTCEPMGKVIHEDVKGQPRLYTPAVSLAAQQQWNCSTGSIGVPLENNAAKGLLSHWESRVMLGSLMTPVISEPHLVFLDRITLSVFEDSGWYKVNYDLAQDYPWGKGQGCQFTDQSTCAQNTAFFCNNDSVIGCHYLHGDIAQCETDQYLDSCSVYKPKNKCQSISEFPDQTSKCFMSNLKSQPDVLTGQCYSTRCRSGRYEISFSDSDSWIPCPPGTTLNVSGSDGIVHCPPFKLICRDTSSILNIIDSLPLISYPPSTSRAPETREETRNVFEVTFKPLGCTVDQGQVERAFISSLCQIIPVNRSQVQMISMDLDKGTLCFTIEPITVQEIYAYAERLTSAVQNKELLLSFNNMSFLAYSFRMVGEPTSTTSSTASMTTTRASPHSDIPVMRVFAGILFSGVVILMVVSILVVRWAVRTLNEHAAVAPLPACDNSQGTAMVAPISTRNPYQVSSSVTYV